MPIFTRTFRVFVSSTFEDLIEERNALQREVFPRLSRLCEAHGARFQPIDLRWGIRDEAVLGQRMMDICLAEIERCQRTGIKPNFIILLGDRYGRPPLPARIQANEFETVTNQVRGDGARALVGNWYKQDDNAVPPEYLLMPRTGTFVNAKRWRKVEQPLHEVLRQAAYAAGLGKDALLKYEGSASHQEIVRGLGTTPDGRKHVFAFFRTKKTADEPPELSDLKQFLRGQLGEGVFEYAADDLARLCHEVAANLKKVILDEVSRFEARSVLDLEIEAHDAFAKDRSKHFVGRKLVLDAVNDYLKGDDRRPLTIHGVLGSGKSAIMAQASAMESVVRRFIGATPESSNGFTLLRSLCQQIARRYGQPEDVPATFSELRIVFSDRIGLATPERPLVLFLDAIDQLGFQDPAVPMNWLPIELPAHCKIVVSTIEVPAALQQGRLVRVEPFSIQDANRALELWLIEERRTLSAAQRDKLLASFRRSPLPLYLKLAFEEARRWRSFDLQENCVLGERLDGIIDVLFRRLSAENNHGPVLVSCALGYLQTARYGLTEGEILDVLTRNRQVWKDFRSRAHHKPPSRRLPTIIWSRLYLDLEPYLTERAVPGGTVVAFYHRQIAERVAATFLAGENRRRRHADLARYFAGQPELAPGVEPEASNGSVANVRSLRRVSELPYQLRHARRWNELRQTLTDTAFLQTKVEADLSADLLEDFAHFGYDGRRITGAKAAAEFCAPLARAFADSVGSICLDPSSLTAQLVLGIQDSHAPGSEAMQERLTQTSPRPVLVRVVRRGISTCDSVAQMSTGGAYKHFLRFSGDAQKLLIGDASGCLTRWDWRDYRVVRSPEPAPAIFRNGALLSDRYYLTTCGEEAWVFGTGNIWDDDLAGGSWQRLRDAPAGSRLGAVCNAASGYALMAQTGPGLNRLLRLTADPPAIAAEWRMPGGIVDPLVNHVAVSRDGATRAICFGQGVLALSTGWIGPAHDGGVYAGEFVESDSAFLTTGDDASVALWDLHHGPRCRLELSEQVGADCLSWSEVRNMAAVGQRNGFVSLCVFGDDPGVVRRFRPGVGGWVLSLCFSPCGRWLAVGGRQNVVRVLDVDQILQVKHRKSLLVSPQPDLPSARSIIVPGGTGCYFFGESDRLYSTLESASESLPLTCGDFALDRPRNQVVAVMPEAIKRLDLATGRSLHESPLKNAWCRSMAISPGGGVLVAIRNRSITSYLLAEDGTFLKQIASAELRTRPRRHLPMCFFEENRVVFPLDEFRRAEGSVADGFVPPDPFNRLGVFNIRSGEVVYTDVTYAGWCHAIRPLDQGGLMALAIGDPRFVYYDDRLKEDWFQYGAAPDSGVLACSITSRAVSARLAAPRDDGGALALSLDSDSNQLAVCFRRGRLRIASIRPLAWQDSVSLPGSAIAVSIEPNGLIYAADDGSTTDSWPVVHGFVHRAPLVRE